MGHMLADDAPSTWLATTAVKVLLEASEAGAMGNDTIADEGCGGVR